MERENVLNCARESCRVQSAVVRGRAPGAYVAVLQDAWGKVRFAVRRARRITRAVGGTLRSRALPHRDRGESDFHAGNDSVRPRCLGPTRCQPPTVSWRDDRSYNNTHGKRRLHTFYYDCLRTDHTELQPEKRGSMF